MQLINDEIDKDYVFVYSELAKKIKNKVFRELKNAKNKVGLDI